MARQLPPPPELPRHGGHLSKPARGVGTGTSDASPLGREEPCDHLEQRRLAGPGGADDDAEGAPVEREADIIEREAPLARGDTVEAVWPIAARGKSQ